nr:MAG TPA: hypothetical protein [Caudoviricetes sp.]
MNLNGKINKLLQAFRARGQIVLLTRKQIFSEQYGVLTKYTVIEQYDTVRSQKHKKKKEVIAEGFKQLDILKALVEHYKGGVGK